MQIHNEDGSLLEKGEEAKTLVNSAVTAAITATKDTASELDEEIVEPDLNSTTFFADKEYLASRELSFPQKVERINALLLANGLNRPTLYRILTTIEDETLPFDELEARIMNMREFNSATQPPSALIEWLEDVEALSIILIDDQGNALTEELCEGKSEDEIDDMIYDMLVTITEYGQGVLDDFDPNRRIEYLLDGRPQRYDTYVDLLTFLKQKRTYLDIDRHLRGNPILMDGLEPTARPMQPSVFVDKLASAGAIVYEQGWIITPEGERFLESAHETPGLSVSDKARQEA